jgi:hypothetical protein
MISAFVSLLSLAVVTVVTVALYYNAVSLKSNVNSDIKNVVNQLNDSEARVSHDMQKHQTSLKKVSSDIENINTSLKDVNSRMTSNVTTLQGNITSLKDATVSKESLVKGVPFVRAGKIQFDDNIQLTSRGLPLEGNSNWMRVMDVSGSNLSGLAIGDLSAANKVWFNGPVVAKSTVSVKGKNNLDTVFGPSGNTLHGNTNIYGNVKNIGNVDVERDLLIGGSLKIKNNNYAMKQGESFAFTTNGAKLHEFESSGKAMHKSVHAETLGAQDGILSNKMTIGPNAFSVHNKHNARLLINDNSSQWSEEIANGNVNVRLAHNGGHGIFVNTNATNTASAMDVNSGAGNLLNVQNTGMVSIGRMDGGGSTNIRSGDFRVNNAINASQNDLKLGSKTKRVLIGNEANFAAADYVKNKVPTTDSIALTNDTYVASKLNVGVPANSPAWPKALKNGVHTTNAIANGIIATVDAKGNYTSYLDNQGKFFTTQTSQASDVRLKDNVKAIPHHEIEKLGNITPSTYTLKSDSEKGQHFGFIAQQVEQVYPNLVDTAPNGYKSVSYDGFIPLVVGNLQKVNTQLAKLDKTAPDSQRLCIDDVCVTKQELAKLKKML